MANMIIIIIIIIGTEISYTLSGRILKSCRLQTYGKHDNNNDNDNNNDKQQFIFYHCRQLKEYDNDNKGRRIVLIPESSEKII